MKAADLEMTWGSQNAEDLFRIATRLAGFDPKELMFEIHRRVMKRNPIRVNVNTVLEAMQTVYDRYDK
jgi:hypothetical protein